MDFALGKPLGVMILLALVSGTVVMLRPAPPQADRVVWVFSPPDAEAFAAILQEHPPRRDRSAKPRAPSVRVELVSSQAIDTRLLSLIMSGRQGAGVPDLVELEIGSVGKFLRAPVEQVGLVPLNTFLQRDGVSLLPNRLAAWSKNGQVFAIPLDVHPVTITYRADLFEAAGVSPADARTWDQFQERCLTAQRHWGPGRYALQLPRSSADVLYLMLLQRGIQLLDADNRPHFTDLRVIDTVMFYAQLVAGPRRIAAEVSSGEGRWAVDLATGAIAAALTPDWRIAQLKAFAPDLHGQVRMMPLPRFDPTDAPTSTWGGTAIAIPRGTPDPEASWRLLYQLCLSPDAVTTRQRITGIGPALGEPLPLPPRPDAYFGGQPIEALYAQLARVVPARQVTPYTALAMQALGAVVSRAADHADRHGTNGLREACRAWLADAERDVARYTAFWETDGGP